MRRAGGIQRAGSFDASGAIDRVVLDAEERHRRRLVLTGERGTRFLLDLDRAVALKHGDGLVLDDGAVVLVTGKPEALIEIEARSPLELARLAWHLGNRHTPVQIADGKLRIRRDHVLEDLVRGLGGKLTPIEAPFDPEPGAHSHPGEQHMHSHQHAHEHHDPGDNHEHGH